MKIYFEDGYLKPYEKRDWAWTYLVDAKDGPTHNEKALDYIYEHQTQHADCIVYTNSLVAIKNSYCWNNELNVPELYLRAGSDNEFVRVDKLTDRQLLCAHNMLALFNNYGFYKRNVPEIKTCFTCKHYKFYSSDETHWCDAWEHPMRDEYVMDDDDCDFYEEKENNK